MRDLIVEKLLFYIYLSLHVRKGANNMTLVEQIAGNYNLTVVNKKRIILEEGYLYLKGSDLGL